VITPRRAPLLAGTAVVVALVAGVVTLLGVAPWQPASSAGAGPVPHFIEDTATSGLAFTYDGPFPYAVGGGIAAFDCNDDGFEDLYIAGGDGRAALFRNASTAGGELRFERIRSASTDLTAVNGAYPIDIDGDGQLDLVALRNGENVILRGLGHCVFQRANAAWDLDGGAEQTEAFSATWEAGATWPTLAFGNHADPGSHDPATWCGTSELVRPRLRTSIVPGFGAPTPLEPGFCAGSMLFSDWDGSGRMDLRVSNDEHYYDRQAGGEQLWRMNPAGGAPRLYTAGEGWALVQIRGMGIASQDLTGDGLPEVYLASQAASRLQTLESGPSRPAYRDIGALRGVNVAQPYAGDDLRLPSTAWHPEFADVNNDGLLDLFVSKGNVTTQSDYAIQDPSNLLLGQPDGTFREAAEEAGITEFDRGRGAALVDFNMDGDLDLVEVSYGAPVRLWRNAGPASGGAASSARWLALRVGQPGPNADAIGAFVEVRSGARVERRELTIGGGHAGGQLGWLHFGVGAAVNVEIRVTWPGSSPGGWQEVSSNAFYVLDRGSPPLVWAPIGGGAE
jgi:hypothetical protein